QKKIEKVVSSIFLGALLTHSMWAGDNREWKNNDWFDDKAIKICLHIHVICGEPIIKGFSFFQVKLTAFMPGRNILEGVIVLHDELFCYGGVTSQMADYLPT
ncbi:hypothetical protein ACJX0J_007320, partial [Zea mays]